MLVRESVVWTGNEIYIFEIPRVFNYLRNLPDSILDFMSQ